MAILISYREYTEDGRFISDAMYETRLDILQEDLENLFDTNDAPTRLQVSAVYKRQGLLRPNETLKELFKTNVTVRDTKTGRFLKWGSLV